MIGLLGSLEINLPADLDAERFRATVWHESYEHGVAVRGSLDSGQVVSVFFYPALVITAQRLQDGLGRALATRGFQCAADIALRA